MTQPQLTPHSVYPEARAAEPGYGHLLGVLLQQRNWVLGMVVGSLAVATGITLLLPPTYRSTMQIMVESNYRERRSANDNRPASFADSNVEIDTATQTNLMRGSELLQRAIADLRPRYGEIDLEELRKKLVVSQIQEQRGTDRVNTNIVEVTYTDHDAAKTQAVLKSLQKVYQEYSLEQQRLRLTRGLSFIEQQLPRATSRVNQAESALEQFRKSQALIDPEQQAKALLESLNTLLKEQQANQNQLAEQQAKYQALQQQLEKSPRQATIAARLSQSSRYQNLLNEMQKTEVALVQQKLRFTDNTPFVAQLQEQRRRQQTLLQQEAQRILGPQAGNLTRSGEGLVAIGQLGDNDLKFAGSLAEAQMNWLAAQARDRTFTQGEQNLRQQLQRFPELLAKYNRLQPDVKVTRETLEQLLKAKQDLSLDIARGGFTWEMIEQPRSGKQIGPSWLKNLVAGALGGLMLGCIAAFTRESRDDSVRSCQDLIQGSAVPLLGLVPEVPTAELGMAPALLMLPESETAAQQSVTQTMNWAPLRESLDLIYKNLQLSTAHQPLNSIALTSALAGEGKSTLALGLAVSAARLHQRVLLVDADLRRPRLHQQLQLPNQQGLSDLLAHPQQSARSAIQSASIYSNLPISVLTAGSIKGDSVQLLSSERMRQLAQEFARDYDFVIFDTPPVLGMVDALLVGSCSDGVLLVSRMGQVNRQEVAEVTQMLDRVNLIGMIANGSDRANQYYYRTASYYGASHYT